MHYGLLTLAKTHNTHGKHTLLTGFFDFFRQRNVDRNVSETLILIAAHKAKLWSPWKPANFAQAHFRFREKHPAAGTTTITTTSHSI